MSGVIDDNGVQWEHCNACGKFVRMTRLGYEKPSVAHEFGRDLCITCVDTGIRAGDIEFANIRPAKGWVVAEVEAA